MLNRILLTGLLASSLLFAQRGGGGSRGGDGDIAPRIAFAGGTRLDRMSEALKLSKDQKKDIKAAMDETQKEAAPIHDQIDKSRFAIAEAIAAGKAQPELDKAILSEAELETQMTSLELHAFAKAVSLLETDQKQRGIAIVFTLVKGAFMGKNWNSD